MYMNFKLKFTGKALKDALWKAAKATYMREYEVALAEMNALSTKAHDWLFILEARDKPIITLLEIIRTKIMQRITKKKVKADKWTTTLCPKIQQKLVASIERSNRCWTTHAGHFKYQVAYGPHTQHIVDVEKHTYSCRIWQLTGIPCNHVVSAIFATDRIPDEFVDQCYKTSTQQEIYNHMVQPVRGNSRLNRRQAHAQPLRGGALPKLPVKRPFRELATKMQQEVIPLISIQRAIKELQHNHQQSM
ncbi:hypothetical protein V6N13_067464 [Hibiscus sabdariffa]